MDFPVDTAGWGKKDWRRFLRQRRQAMSSRPEFNRLIESHLRTLVEKTGAQTVATYLATGSEPSGFPDANRHLVPVVLPSVNIFEASPAWGEAPVELFAGCPYPIRQTPNPPPPLLPAEALSQADLVLVPGLGVDSSGTRLGQGAGWYDRALRFAREDVELWGIVFSDCFLPEAILPVDPWDRPLTGVVTELGLHRFN